MPDEESLDRLRAIVGKLARTLNAAASDEGLTPTQASVLGAVTIRGPLELAELARLEGLSASMLSRTITCLSDRDLIVRSPGAHDHRTITVTATPAGVDLTRQIRRQRNRIIGEAISQLPVEQATSIAASLDGLEALYRVLRGDDAIIDPRSAM